MTLGRQKTVLFIAATVVALAGVTILVAGIVMPVAVVPSTSVELLITGSPSKEGNDVPNDTQEKSKAWRQDLLTICSVDLRPPLFDAPSLASATKVGDSVTQGESPVVQVATLSVRLVGTIVEPGHSMALVMQPTGDVKLVAPGEHFEDSGVAVMVVKIERWKVTVLRAGQQMDLHLPTLAEGEMP